MIEIWAEKYRPDKLDELINQEHVVSRLKAFVKERNIPHMLFAGGPGTGKTTCALVVAKELYGEQWKANTLELNASVTPDTPILIKENGEIKRITIGELANRFVWKDGEKYKEVEGVEILSVDRETLRVGFKKIKNISRHKVDKIARIRFEGSEIKTSLDHSVIIFDENFKLLSKKVEELEPGNYLISFTSILDGNKDEIDLSFYKPKKFNKLKSGKIKNLKIKRMFNKLKVDAELAYFFGCYLAEGCLRFRGNRSEQIIFPFDFPSEIEKVKEIVNKKLRLNNTIEKGYSEFDGRNSSINLRIFNIQLAKFIANEFYWNGRKIARNKKLPSLLYSLPIKQRMGFLEFLNNGSEKWNKRVRFTDLAWFSRLSGCYARTTHDRKDLLPANLFIDFAKKISKKIEGNWRYILRHNLYGKKSKFISKKNAKRFLSLVNKEKLSYEEKKILENLKSIVNSDLNAVKIKEIKVEKYEDWVYDVSVEDSEMFFGGSLPILLHNSDARGIDVIRGQVKEFARSKAIGEVPFKIIIMDEADALTNEAQQALRRMMEDYASITRFILTCNYSSKIIEPIQSRCAVFRFKTLSDEHQKEFINRIVKKEKLKITEAAINAIIRVCEGDLRKVANILQASAVLGKKMDEDLVYEVAALAKPREVKRMIDLAMSGKFKEAREELQRMILREGLAGEDVVREIYRQVHALDIPVEKKLELIEKVGEAEFRISEGGDPLIQLTSLLAQFALISK